ncbi:MAG: DUF2341 domain-containing protein [Candidatus Aenigmatarchaeota archaeon]
MRSDCGDIRFTDSDGITLLNYWIEPNTCNTENTKIWVKIPNIPSNSNKIIYLYYGNPNANSLSNVKNVFIREIDGLVLYLPFDEGSGNIVYDYSGNNNNGTIYGATFVDSPFNKALSFDGVDDYVGIPDSPTLRLTDKIAISAWVKCINTGNFEVIITGRTFTYFLAISQGTIRWYLGNGTSWFLIEASVPISYDAWNHIVVDYDSSTGTYHVYLNGILKK